MKSLLVILNPRYLPECLLSLEQLNCDKVWVKNYTERDLETVLPDVFSQADHDNFIVVSDDVIATQAAFDEVEKLLNEGYKVATGYCNLDPVSEYCSLTKSPPKQPYATEATYDWMTLGEVHRDRPDIIQTYHPSFAMTGMSREMWEKFPWRCFGKSGRLGWAADLDLSIRLRDSGIPIFAPKRAFIYHTKPNWKIADANVYERRALRVEKEAPDIVWELS